MKHQQNILIICTAAGSYFLIGQVPIEDRPAGTHWFSSTYKNESAWRAKSNIVWQSSNTVKDGTSRYYRLISGPVCRFLFGKRYDLYLFLPACRKSQTD